MLGIAGFAEGGSATISELAEFLQERNNSVVGLVERAAQSGLVRRESGAQDRRQVVVSLTSRGEDILAKLSELHLDEVQRMRAGFLSEEESGSVRGRHRQNARLARERRRHDAARERDAARRRTGYPNTRPAPTGSQLAGAASAAAAVPAARA